MTCFLLQSDSRHAVPQMQPLGGWVSESPVVPSWLPSHHSVAFSPGSLPFSVSLPPILPQSYLNLAFHQNPCQISFFPVLWADLRSALFTINCIPVPLNSWRAHTLPCYLYVSKILLFMVRKTLFVWFFKMDFRVFFLKGKYAAISICE